LKRVLVIKFGGLGDVVRSFAALVRIREAHPEAEITVLTTPPYAPLYAASPYVDRVESDGRSKEFRKTFALIVRLRRSRYDRVYDLQTSARSSRLFYGMLPFPPQWSGIALGASHRHRNPHRDSMHALEQKADQLKAAGIWPDAPITPGQAPPPDLSWAVFNDQPNHSPKFFGLAEPFCLMVPGASLHRPCKRWPVERYAALARVLRAEGLNVGVIAGPAEKDLAAAIPLAKDLTGKTDLLQIASLGARAAFAVGNDTGPTHILAAAGAPTLVLFSSDSDPALCAPRGRRVALLRQDRLSDLPLDTVLSALDSLYRVA
jgi:ADP-heptose:LPS heptosyltransferase